MKCPDCAAPNYDPHASYLALANGDAHVRNGKDCKAAAVIKNMHDIIMDCGANYHGKLELTAHTPDETIENERFSRGLVAAQRYCQQYDG